MDAEAITEDAQVPRMSQLSKDAGSTIPWKESIRHLRHKSIDG